MLSADQLRDLIRQLPGGASVISLNMGRDFYCLKCDHNKKIKPLFVWIAPLIKRPVCPVCLAKSGEILRPARRRVDVAVVTAAKSFESEVTECKACGLKLQWRFITEHNLIHEDSGIHECSICADVAKGWCKECNSIMCNDHLIVEGPKGVCTFCAQQGFTG